MNNTDRKRPEQTQNIVFKKLINNHPNELYKGLMQFGHDSGEQCSRELIRKSINLEDMKNIDSIRMTGFVSEESEGIRKINEGEICMFGHRKDADLWLPFTLENQINLEVVIELKSHKTFSVDENVFYNEIDLRKKFDAQEICLSDNLSIDITNGKFIFKPVSKLDMIKKDIRFLKVVPSGEKFYIDGYVACSYKADHFSSDFYMSRSPEAALYPQA